jgi:uncharacterized protein (TIGR02145 family)
MKKLCKIIVIGLLLLLMPSLSLNAQVSINSNGDPPDNSAMLDVRSTNKGFLPPRMTYVQRTAIASPVAGLIIWCSNCGASGELQVYNGSAWTAITTGPASSAKPDAPTIGTATAGNAQALISFTAPASDGGSIITSYTATSNPGSITGTLNQAGSGTITVTGLTIGIAYTFTLTATNSVGTSAASAASNSVTPFANVTTATGKIWMDRNLGASQVATSSTDASSYGDLYQWGRAADGHQIRTSGTTPTNATTALPNGGNSWDGLFITEDSSPFDWLTPQDNTLWQGVSGTNNPCPSGYRLPTEAEWNAERASWSSNNAAGAFASPLKLPVAGFRINGNGTLQFVGAIGWYWSSLVDGASSGYLAFSSSTVAITSGGRAYGYSVRCIKD